MSWKAYVRLVDPAAEANESTPSRAGGLVRDEREWLRRRPG